MTYTNNTKPFVPAPDRIKGLVYGLALGDAWGKPTEFLPYDELEKMEVLYRQLPEPLVVTDDTQMSLYAMDACRWILGRWDVSELDRIATTPYLQNKVRMVFADYFVKFAADPLNNRAPGMACMTSLKSYAYIRRMGLATTGLEGITGETAYSKGCGTIMRAPWLALLPVNDTALATIAILQSQTTHGHPTASIAAAWMTLLIRRVLMADDPRAAALEIVSTKSIERTFRELDEHLVDDRMLNQFMRNYNDAGQATREYINSGFTDPCEYFGQGWTADEAFFCAALAVVCEYDNIRPCLQHLVISNGDSDSLGALGGALLGAMHGYAKLDEAFGTGLEAKFEAAYINELADTAKELARWGKGQF